MSQRNSQRNPAFHRTKQELEDLVNGHLGGTEGRLDLVCTVARLVIEEGPRKRPETS